MAILATAATRGEPVADAARRMSRTQAVFEPRAAMRAHLDEQYERLVGEFARRGWLAAPDPVAPERTAVLDGAARRAGLNVLQQDGPPVQASSGSRGRAVVRSSKWGLRRW